MEISSLFLYIAQPDDTLSIIADRFHTSIEDVLRYNPNLHHQEPRPGQPLNIKTTADEIRAFKAIKRPKCIEFNLNTALVKVAFYTKDCILSFENHKSNIFFLLHYLDSLFHEILEKQYHINVAEDIASYKTKMHDIVDHIIVFSEIIIKKDAASIKAYKCQQKDILADLKTVSIEAVLVTENDLINHLDLWNLYTLKIISNRYEEAHVIFLQILTDIERITLLL